MFSVSPLNVIAPPQLPTCVKSQWTLLPHPKPSPKKQDRYKKQVSQFDSRQWVMTLTSEWQSQVS